MADTQTCPHCNSAEQHQLHADKDHDTFQCSSCGKFFNDARKFMDDKVYEAIGIPVFYDVTLTIKKELNLMGTLTDMSLGKESVAEKHKVFVVGEVIHAGLEGYDEETNSIKINFNSSIF